MGGEAAMLIDDVERYIALRRSLGFQLRKPARHLRAFACVAAKKGEAHIRATTVIEWAAAAPTLDARNRRIGDVARFARFLRPRTQSTRCRQPLSSPRRNCGLLLISTRRTSWCDCLMQPRNSVCTNPIRCDGKPL